MEWLWLRCSRRGKEDNRVDDETSRGCNRAFYGQRWKTDTGAMEIQHRRSRLALLLVVYGQHPELQKKLVEPLFEYWEAVDKAKLSVLSPRGRGIDFRNSVTTMAVMGLYDPERAVTLLNGWWSESSERMNRDSNSPWTIVGDVLTADGDQLCRLISKRIYYSWILGEDDRY